jgi:hypothetical protein
MGNPPISHLDWLVGAMRGGELPPTMGTPLLSMFRGATTGIRNPITGGSPVGASTEGGRQGLPYANPRVHAKTAEATASALGCSAAVSFRTVAAAAVPPRPQLSNMQAAKGLTTTLKPDQAASAKQGRAFSETASQQLKAVAWAHHEKKMEASSLDPVLSSETPMKQSKGKSKKRKKKMRLMKLSVLAIMAHPFGKELAKWDTGVEVDCGEKWTQEAVHIAVNRGPHSTARTADALALVHKDIKYQVEAGFTEVVYWDEIKDKLPPNFKISPVAVIPQTGRQGRIILDLSFPVRCQPQKDSKRRTSEVVAESVNDTTKQLAPQGPVHEIGKVLPRLFQCMTETPPDQEIRLSKVDLSDGFWRLIIEPELCLAR